MKLVLALQYCLTDRSKAVLLLWIICVIYVFCLSCFHVCSLLPCTCWEKADLLAQRLFVTFNCTFVTFTCGILGQVWNLIVSIPDLYPLSYFGNDRLD